MLASSALKQCKRVEDVDALLLELLKIGSDAGDFATQSR
jgi:hypothetical protein